MTTAKFGYNATAEALYEMTLDGADANAGDVNETGMYGSLLTLTEEEGEKLGLDNQFVIVFEDSDGFVTYKDYVLEVAAYAALATLEASYAEEHGTCAKCGDTLPDDDLMRRGGDSEGTFTCEDCGAFQLFPAEEIA